ncbi:MAG: type III-A CRISPR-associated RAMP protein Csm4 [Thermaurantimonas sp.]|uniref:type III-A CRISPR-associated RAMP protein Csm4 n=1 Tax=Thermaurantimonas sp. TaxID=2681568 RepID=UPI0039188571
MTETKTYKAIHLHIRGPLHIGVINDVQDELQELWGSDSIKSALSACALSLDLVTDVKEFLDAFKLSSAFYFIQSQNTYVQFFPRPIFPGVIHVGHSDDITHRKKAKKIQWIDIDYFEKILSAGKLQLSDTDQILFGKFLTSKVVELNPYPFEGEPVYETDDERVSIGPIYTEQGDPYYFRRRYFHPQVGLYFLYEGDDKTLYEKIVPALRLLADEGIGSDRSVGGGWFEFDPGKDIVDIELHLPKNASGYLAFGKYCPTRDELTKADLEQSAYQVTRRGGYISSPGIEEIRNKLKRTVYMMEEGSYLATTEKPEGKCVDLKPDTEDLQKALPGDAFERMHPVWRDGRPIFIPANFKFESI